MLVTFLYSRPSIIIIYLSFQSAETVVLSYNLVRWEDLSGGLSPRSVCKEGELFYKAYDSIMWGEVWRQGYFVFKYVIESHHSELSCKFEGGVKMLLHFQSQE